MGIVRFPSSAFHRWSDFCNSCNSRHSDPWHRGTTQRKRLHPLQVRPCHSRRCRRVVHWERRGTRTQFLMRDSERERPQSSRPIHSPIPPSLIPLSCVGYTCCVCRFMPSVREFFCSSATACCHCRESEACLTVADTPPKSQPTFSPSICLSCSLASLPTSTRTPLVELR